MAEDFPREMAQGKPLFSLRKSQKCRKIPARKENDDRSQRESSVVGSFLIKAGVQVLREGTVIAIKNTHGENHCTFMKGGSQ